MEDRSNGQDQKRVDRNQKTLAGFEVTGDNWK
jgi:hypothetical protein